MTLGTVFNDTARFSTILAALGDVDATVLTTIGATTTRRSSDSCRRM